MWSRWIIPDLHSRAKGYICIPALCECSDTIDCRNAVKAALSVQTYPRVSSHRGEISKVMLEREGETPHACCSPNQPLSLLLLQLKWTFKTASCHSSPQTPRGCASFRRCMLFPGGINLQVTHGCRGTAQHSNSAAQQQHSAAQHSNSVPSRFCWKLARLWFIADTCRLERLTVRIPPGVKQIWTSLRQKALVEGVLRLRGT